jgi:hypothetical protein
MGTQYIIKTARIECHYKDREFKTLHREDGPAYKDWEVVQYHINGKLHRTDGPAYIPRVIGMNSKPSYWLEGECYSDKKDFDLEVRRMNDPAHNSVVTLIPHHYLREIEPTKAHGKYKLTLVE